MNVLEKILKEIEKHAIEFESFGMCDDYVSVGWVKEIIRSKMDKIPKCGECSRRKWYQKGYEDGRKDNGWIPVEEGFPEETGYYLAQLSRKLPSEDYSDRVVVLFNGEEKEFMCYANLIIAWHTLPEWYKPDEKSKETN